MFNETPLDYRHGQLTSVAINGQKREMAQMANVVFLPQHPDSVSEVNEYSCLTVTMARATSCLRGTVTRFCSPHAE